MKVNMTPNPLDVVTIHASQGDTEARQWEFELHNNGELIDTSDVKEQLVFKAYEGGTEQLLPENTSTPTTSPFIGDIRYPQGLLTNQEFLYRESPTEKDGNAKIKNLHGNTLVWNQLINNGNFASTNGWSPNIQANTITASSNELTVNINTLGNNAGVYSTRLLHNRIANHKYLFKVDIYVPHATTVRFGGENEIQRNIITGWNTVYGIVQSSITSKVTVCYITATEALGFASGETYKIKNYQCFDLTQMGYDSIVDPSEFTSIFSLPYYAYNQGSLLSFNGNGIKTVGKNIFDGVLQNGTIDQYGQEQPQANKYRSGFIRVLPNITYFSSIDGVAKALNFFFYDGNQNFISSTGGAIVTTPSNCAYIRFFYDQTILNVNLQVEIGSSPTSYEPYTSSTLSLPISTYFPTGMKSVPSAYDELTPNKAITRVGMVDLGSLTYVKEAPSTEHPDWPLFWGPVPGALGRYGAYGNTQICAKYSNRASSTWQDKTIGFGAASTNINIADTEFADYTVDQVKQALSGVMLYYKLATPTETSFTTASLVTENAEIPLSNEDGTLIGECTEQLSAEPGFHDAKIKLSDSDGTCYSNKLQLHVERKPS